MRVGNLILIFLCLFGFLSGTLNPFSTFFVSRPVSSGVLGHGTLPANIRPDAASSLDHSTNFPTREGWRGYSGTFELNQGQAPASVKFLSRGLKQMLTLTKTEALLLFFGSGPGQGSVHGTAVRMRFRGASERVRLEGLGPLPSRSNYFIGRDPNRWRVDVGQYARVHYRDLYPGIDLIFHGANGQLEYDFIVAPGADPSLIDLQFDGASPLRLSSSGDLLIPSSGGQLRQRRPVAYQEIQSLRHIVPCRFTLRPGNHVRFELDGYDSHVPVVIDPVLEYASYLGGNSTDLGWGIALDAAGNAYVAGTTPSTDFPVANAFQPLLGGRINPVIKAEDAFVAKFDPSGALVYSTYLGGSLSDWGMGIAVDSAGNAHVTGATASEDFPLASPLKATLGGITDAFVAKLNPSGSTLIYSTYLGGGSGDGARAIAVDGSGNACVAGYTRSADFPTVRPIQAGFAGGTCTINDPDPCYDAFVAKLMPRGDGLIYATYIGGSQRDLAYAIAADAQGACYVAGLTRSPDFPTAAAFQTKLGDPSGDGFVLKIDSMGSALVYSSYLGGDQSDSATAIATDTAGTAFVTGDTSSPKFPVVSALQANLAGTSDAFVTALHSGGGRLLFSTYLGGAGREWGMATTTDVAGNVYVGGQTDSADFPAVRPLQPGLAGDSDAFVVKLSAPQFALHFSTLLGGRGNDGAHGIAVDVSGNIHVTGTTTSHDFPVTRAFQREARRGINLGDVFVAKIAPGPDVSGTTYFAQIAIGGGYSTFVTLLNTGSAAAIGKVLFTSPTGSSFPVRIRDPFQAPDTASQFLVSLSPGGTQTFWVDGPLGDNRVRSGWVRIEWIGGSVNGVATFRRMEAGVLTTVVGILSSSLMRSAVMPVDYDEAAQRFTGFAMVNATGNNLNIRLVVRDSDGTIVNDLAPPELNPLAAGGQVARYFHEYLPALVQFKGSVQVQAEAPGVVVVGLVQDRGQLTAIPVVMTKP